MKPESGVDEVLQIGLARVYARQLQNPVGARPVDVGQRGRGEGGTEAPSQLFTDRHGHLIAPE